MNSKLWLLAGIAVTGAVALYSSTQVWVTLSLTEGAAAFSELAVTGQQMNQSLSPVAIAVLAAALALTIAGTVFRRVLGVLVLLLGAGLGAIAVAVMRDPAAAVAGRLGEATGLTGFAQAELIASVSVSPLVLVTLVAGALLLGMGLLVLVLGGRWKTAGRKYESDSGRAKQQNEEPDRISDWEALNSGQDPSDT
jgi:uncharacterized membrane protein (TIGR02234 family)